jgi:hypothetical protein
MSSDVRESAARLALVEWLARPQLFETIDAILSRFDTGEDPLPEDEAHVSALLRARAWLDDTAPQPDPLAERLEALDASWAGRSSVAWVLEDADWLACFADLPSPHAWWGARQGPRAPSEQAVLEALAEMAGQDRRDR